LSQVEEACCGGGGGGGRSEYIYLVKVQQIFFSPNGIRPYMTYIKHFYRSQATKRIYQSLERKEHRLFLQGNRDILR
jgi:hypothetical protein